MDCAFDGEFTRKEKATISAALADFSEIAGLTQDDAGASWHVEREENPEWSEPDPLPLRARHPETDVEIYGRSVEHLINEIEKVAEIVSNVRNR